MHCHATNLIALTYVLENHSDLFTRKLWEGSTECLVVFPDGVGILPWMVPGTDEIGQATAETMQKHSLVLWPFHGVFGSGPTLDEDLRPDRYRREVRRGAGESLVDGRDGSRPSPATSLSPLGKRFNVQPLQSALDLYP